MADNQLRRDASNRLSFEMPGVSADDYPAVCAAVTAALALAPDAASFIAGQDAVAMTFRRNRQVIELAWDNWSGFIATALTADSESLIREVADWLLHSAWGGQTQA